MQRLCHYRLLGELHSKVTFVCCVCQVGCITLMSTFHMRAAGTVLTVTSGAAALNCWMPSNASACSVLKAGLLVGEVGHHVLDDVHELFLDAAHISGAGWSTR